jgi:hypothetical protein
MIHSFRAPYFSSSLLVLSMLLASPGMAMEQKGALRGNLDSENTRIGTVRQSEPETAAAANNGGAAAAAAPVAKSWHPQQQAMASEPGAAAHPVLRGNPQDQQFPTRAAILLGQAHPQFDPQVAQLVSEGVARLIAQRNNQGLPFQDRLEAELRLQAYSHVDLDGLAVLKKAMGEKVEGEEALPPQLLTQARMHLATIWIRDMDPPMELPRHGHPAESLFYNLSGGVKDLPDDMKSEAELKKLAIAAFVNGLNAPMGRKFPMIFDGFRDVQNDKSRSQRIRDEAGFWMARICVLGARLSNTLKELNGREDYLRTVSMSAVNMSPPEVFHLFLAASLNRELPEWMRVEAGAFIGLMRADERLTDEEITDLEAFRHLMSVRQHRTLPPWMQDLVEVSIAGMRAEERVTEQEMADSEVGKILTRVLTRLKSQGVDKVGRLVSSEVRFLAAMMVFEKRLTAEEAGLTVICDSFNVDGLGDVLVANLLQDFSTEELPYRRKRTQEGRNKDDASVLFAMVVSRQIDPVLEAAMKAMRVGKEEGQFFDILRNARYTHNLKRFQDQANRLWTTMCAEGRIIDRHHVPKVLEGAYKIHMDARQNPNLPEWQRDEAGLLAASMCVQGLARDAKSYEDERQELIRRSEDAYGYPWQAEYLHSAEQLRAVMADIVGRMSDGDALKSFVKAKTNKDMPKERQEHADLFIAIMGGQGLADDKVMSRPDVIRILLGALKNEVLPQRWRGWAGLSLAIMRGEGQVGDDVMHISDAIQHLNRCRYALPKESRRDHFEALRAKLRDEEIRNEKAFWNGVPLPRQHYNGGAQAAAAAAAPQQALAAASAAVAPQQ